MVTTTKAIVKADFKPETVELIKRTVATGTTNDEFEMFLYQARKSGLDPLSKQIYIIKRKIRVKDYDKTKGTWVEKYIEKATIQASIDGLRVIAQRSGDYAGQEEPKFEEDAQGNPIKCTVVLYKFDKKGSRYQAAVGVAYWKEYVPSDDRQAFMWKKMPHQMLAKVAESIALRKAFPQDLYGLYAQEEEEVVQEEINSPVVEEPETIEEPSVAKEEAIKPEEPKSEGVKEQPPQVETKPEEEEVPEKPISFGQKVLLQQFAKRGKVDLTDEQIEKLNFENARSLIAEIK